MGKKCRNLRFTDVSGCGRGASLLVLPEALLARDDLDPDLSVKSAQLLEGGFLTRLLRESAQNEMTTILTIHVPSVHGRAFNMLVALRAGQVVAHYAKLHLYDAFSIQESRNVDAGDVIAPLLDVGGLKVGLMTCYDLRFPELALVHALQGAEISYYPQPGYGDRLKSITGLRFWLQER